MTWTLDVRSGSETRIRPEVSRDKLIDLTDRSRCHVVGRTATDEIRR